MEMWLRKASWTSVVLSMAYRLRQSVKFWRLLLNGTKRILLAPSAIAVSFPIKNHVEDGNVNWPETAPPPSDIFSYVCR